MTTYKMSNGERVEKSTIDYRVREAKKQVLDNQLKEHGYNFCKECGRSAGMPLDCSHIISVDRCQKEGRSELAWDITNVEVLCRFHHNLRDKLY